MRHSVAMPGAVDAELRAHLKREDRQEDVVAATFRWSSGAGRTTALLTSVIPPRAGERLVHGNASFTSNYVIRAATHARDRGEGLVLLHSHPRGRGWQDLSRDDRGTESDYERLARQITSLPLVGMTLAGGDGAWSARVWHSRQAPSWCESVRIVSDKLTVSWNDRLVPRPRVTDLQDRTVSSWGEETQATMARLRVLVVGVGSVGLDIAQRLAATGVTKVGVMDFDEVERHNLDRMIGATRLDARVRRAKTDVAARLMTAAATATSLKVSTHPTSICDPAGLAVALDYDVIFSCVDRPWPRAMLNLIAYADLIPVIDGGIALDTLPNGGMRGGIWRAHTLVPDRPCMLCAGQLDLNELALDQQGLLDDPQYIATANRKAPARQNVAALAAGVSAALLAQYVSLVAHPGGMGVPAPLRFLIGPHHLEHLSATTGTHCPYQAQLALGDHRTDLVDKEGRWRQSMATSPTDRKPMRLRAAVQLDRLGRLAVDRLLGPPNH